MGHRSLNVWQGQINVYLMLNRAHISIGKTSMLVAILPGVFWQPAYPQGDASARAAGELKTALELLKRWHPDRAMPVLEALLTKQPKNIRAFLAKADALAWMEKRDESMTLLNSILKSDPQNSAAYALRSHLHFALGAYHEAQADANAAIKADPKNADGYFALAEVYRLDLKWRESAFQCKKGLDVDRNSSDAWRQDAVIRKNGRVGQNTVISFEKAIKLAPDDIRNYDELARFYIERKMYEKAMPACDRALQIDPEDGFALLDLGRIWLARMIDP